jgi:hypothetical protein
MEIKPVILLLNWHFALNKNFREIKVPVDTPILVSMSESLRNLHNIADDIPGIARWNAGETAQTTHI